MLGKGKNPADIPIAESVPGFYLKRVSYKKTMTFEGIEFSFVRDGAWVNMLITNPEKIDDLALLKNRRYLAALKIESIAALFLEKSAMRECFQDSDNFQEFVDNLIQEFNKTNYRSVELDLKILPGPKVGFSIPFVRKTGDMKKILRYSDFELKTINNARNAKAGGR